MDDTFETTLAAPAPALFAARYEIGEELGRGGFGTVHAAVDRVDGATVALKRFHSYDEEDALRFGREAAALRLLRHPGVVRLYDHGHAEGVAYLVMELAHGQPFPARPIPLPWDALAPLALRLLETLAAVHDAGVIHRDLKPSNILVDDHGRLKLLDFGLARGAALGPTLTLAGTALGTPFYLAPEQAFGQHAGPRSDLWSVGALLLEALTGKPPHDPQREVLAGFLVRRGTEPLPPTRDLLPDLAPTVAAALDALLAHRPEDRPASAGDALALFTRGAPRARPTFAELRPDALATALATVLDAGHALDLSGPRGAGHTHLLDRLAAAATARGRRPVRAIPARTPYQSLVHLTGPLDAPDEATLDDVHALALATARAALAAGAILLVDDAETLDPQSARLLDALGPHHPVARVLPRDAVAPDRPHLPLPPLPADAFASLFTGPDRILHLREDGARELHRRSRGLPGPAVAELERWIALGLAERDGERVRITRADLERLATDSHTARTLRAPGERLDRTRRRGSPDVSAVVRRASHVRDAALLITLAGEGATLPVLRAAWRGPRWLWDAALDELARLELLAALPDGTLGLDGLDLEHLDGQPADRATLHGALGEALPRGDSRRLLHFVAAGRLADAVAAALEVGRRLAHEGFLARAHAVLGDALALARANGLSAATLDLLVELTRCALLEASAAASHRLLFELRPERNLPLDPAPLRALARLAEANIDLAEQGGGRVPDLLDGLDFPDDPTLASWAWSLRVRAARAKPVEDERRVVADALAWAEASDTAIARAQAASWRGRLAYREGRWDEAGAHYAAALADPGVPEGIRLAAGTNAASAWIEARRYDQALAVNAMAASAAARCRDANFELRAAWLARLAGQRRGDALDPDPELCELADLAGPPYIAALLRAIDLALAFRAQDREALQRDLPFALRAAVKLRMASLSALLLPLAMGLDGDRAPERRAAVLEALGDVDHATLRLQILALLALFSGPLSPEEHALARAAWMDVPLEQRGDVADLLRPAEAWAVLEASQEGRWGRLPRWLAAWRAEAPAGHRPN